MCSRNIGQECGIEAEIPDKYAPRSSGPPTKYFLFEPTPSTQFWHEHDSIERCLHRCRINFAASHKIPGYTNSSGLWGDTVGNSQVSLWGKETQHDRQRAWMGEI
eukprot:764959-Hanusia_phi.AAC.1